VEKKDCIKHAPHHQSSLRLVVLSYYFFNKTTTTKIVTMWTFKNPAVGSFALEEADS